jgi:hypothetical protein
MACRDFSQSLPAPTKDRLRHAEFHARTGEAAIGASVAFSDFDDGSHIWDCVVTDGREWHYLRVIGSELGPYPQLSSEDVEQGIERFAVTLPRQDRLRHLLNANPLHIDPDGTVHD